MPRPSQVDAKRQQLLPALAKTFAELGYRRATTAELAHRCNVQENILYRLWPDKKAMFIAAIDHIYERSVDVWEKLLSGNAHTHSAQALLEYEAEHLGEFGHARIIFAGLSETDDPEIRSALARMYQRYQKFVESQLLQHGRLHGTPQNEPALAAWAFVGLGTVISIARELRLLSQKERSRLMLHVGQLLLHGHAE